MFIKSTNKLRFISVLKQTSNKMSIFSFHWNPTNLTEHRLFRFGIPIIQVIVILKYYLYKCTCVADKPSINGSLKYLKSCFKIEKTTMNFLSSTQKERGCNMKLSLVSESSVKCCEMFVSIN